MGERLDFLSDQVRKGIPVELYEAIAVVDYQEKLRSQRERIWWRRLLRMLKVDA